MSETPKPRTTRGGSERQWYTPPHDAGVTYEIEHNHTDYYVKLGLMQIAAARFPSKDGKDPGWDFTCDRAVEVIEAFYRGDHASVHGMDMIDSCWANSLVWKEARAAIKKTT